MAACGHAHTLAVTKAGLLWAWGEGVGGEMFLLYYIIALLQSFEITMLYDNDVVGLF